MALSGAPSVFFDAGDDSCASAEGIKLTPQKQRGHRRWIPGRVRASESDRIHGRGAAPTYSPGPALPMISTKVASNSTPRGSIAQYIEGPQSGGAWGEPEARLSREMTRDRSSGVREGHFPFPTNALRSAEAYCKGTRARDRVKRRSPVLALMTRMALIQPRTSLRYMNRASSLPVLLTQ